MSSQINGWVKTIIQIQIYFSLVFLLLEKNDACVVDADCEELGATAACVSLICTIVDETSTPKPTDGPTASTTAGTETTVDNENESTTEGEIEPNTDTTTEAESSGTTVVPARHSRVRKQFSKALVHSSPTHKDFAVQATLPLTNGDSELLISPRRSREIAVQTSIEKYELKELVARQVRNVATATTTASTSVSSRYTSTNNTQSNYRRRLPAIFRYDNEDIKTYSTLGSSRDDEDVDDKKCEYKLNTYSFSISISHDQVLKLANCFQ